MKNKFIVILIIVIIVLLAGTALILLRGDEDTWICGQMGWEKHGNPAAPRPPGSQCLPQD